jgi:hypothetical protein
MSSVSKQSPIRPAQQPKKSAGKASRPRKTSSRVTKVASVEAPAEDDLSDLVPSREVRTAVLKLAKVDPEWLDDAYSGAKSRKK